MRIHARSPKAALCWIVPTLAAVSPGDRITAYITTRNNTTYVTYTAKELPLTTLIRGIFGDYIANVTAPLLKLAVDFGYYGGNPIPSDPSAYRPGAPSPSIGDVVTTISKLPGRYWRLWRQSWRLCSRAQCRPDSSGLLTRSPAPPRVSGADKPLTNSLENGLDAVPSGDGDANAAATTSPGPVVPDLGTGQPTA